jgi:hypothetical protein
MNDGDNAVFGIGDKNRKAIRRAYTDGETPDSRDKRIPLDNRTGNIRHLFYHKNSIAMNLPAAYDAIHRHPVLRKILTLPFGQRVTVVCQRKVGWPQGHPGGKTALKIFIQ